MTPKKNHFSGQAVFMQWMMFILLFIAGSKAFSQTTHTDSSRLLAAVDKKAAHYFIKESNVVFPEILKGNEEQVLDYIETFSTKRREYLLRMYKNGKVLLPKAATILKKHNLPEELKVLLTLESAYNANAKSPAGAVGYWQFMDVVAKEYGLRYTAQEKAAAVKKADNKKAKKLKVEVKEKGKKKQQDDRCNFDKSTVAAARYLKDRRANLDDNWLLVVASYNCGVGNVWSAMEKSGKDSPTFWDIKKFLPAETQAYVMNFITLNVIFSNYDKFASNNLILKPVKILIPDNFEKNMTDGLEGFDKAGIQ